MSTPDLNALSQWQAYLANISTNLIELSDQMEFQLIEAKSKDTVNGYTGMTKIKVDKCMGKVRALWKQFASLSELNQKAKTLYDKHGFLFNAEEAVKELLDNTLIVVESEHLELSDRKLLSGENNEKKATSQELLKYMEESFESIKEDISEISKAEALVSERLKSVKAEIADLNNRLKLLNISNAPRFDANKIKAVESDPLQGLKDIDKLWQNTANYRASIKDIEDKYNDVLSTISKVQSMLAELRDISEKSEKAIIESQRIFSVQKNFKPFIKEEIVMSLEDWLKVLENKLAEGAINAVRIGISKLMQECSSKLEIERENYSINCKDYDEWLDLKGQFKVLLVKTEVLRAKKLLYDNSIDKLIEETRAAIYGSPVELSNCRQLVRKFSQSLIG